MPIDRLEAFSIGQWRDYKPIWTALTTNPSLGNGKLRGRFVRQGKIIYVNVILEPGSTTTFGSGEWRFSLPTKAKDTGYTGTAYMLDAGTAHRIGVARVTDLLDPARAGVYTEAGAGAAAAAVPFTWANGDYLTFFFTYEMG